MVHSWRQKKGIIFIILMLSAQSGRLFSIIEDDKPVKGEAACTIERFLFAKVMNELEQKRRKKTADEIKPRLALLHSQGINVPEGFLTVLMHPGYCRHSDQVRCMKEALPSHQSAEGYVALWGRSDTTIWKAITGVMKRCKLSSPNTYLVLTIERDAKSDNARYHRFGLYIGSWKRVYVFVYGQTYRIASPYLLPELCDRLTRNQRLVCFHYMVFSPRNLP